MSATAARIASNLEQIRGTGQDEAIAIDGASERATASLRDLIDAMRGQTQAIEINFQEAADNTVGRVTGAGDAASAEIRTAADTASHAIGEAGARIANDVSRASDGALENARIIGEELGQHAANVGESFEAAVARASDRLAELSREALVRAGSFTQEMSGQAEQTSASFERVEQVSENAAQRTRESAEAASASVAQTAQSLEAAVTSIRLEVDVMTDGLRTQADGFAEMARANFEQVEEMGARLRGYASELADAGDQADAQGRSLGETFRTEADVLEVLARAATAQAERVSSELREAASNLSRSTEVAATAGTEVRESFAEHAETIQGEIDRAETMASTFRMQERAPVEAVEEVVRTSQEVKDTYIDSNRGVIMHRVNRVLDTLGSIGVDLDRILEGDVAADIARRFSKGDRTVAVRRLASRVKEPVAIANVRELFEEDDEFRALVTRYLREFERLMTQASEADPDELLSASLLTADIGKAYLLLSRALDRHK